MFRFYPRAVAMSNYKRNLELSSNDRPMSEPRNNRAYKYDSAYTSYCGSPTHVKQRKRLYEDLVICLTILKHFDYNSNVVLYVLIYFEN